MPHFLSDDELQRTAPAETATFASPVLLRPAALGADVVIHSLTKYVNGHGDVMAGSVAGSAEVAKAMRDRTILDGAYLPPHEAWLCIRGMRTLELRVRRQCESALRVARHLNEHPKVARVRYPGLPDHPQHALAKRQFGGLFGGVVTFDLKDATKPAAFRFLDALQLAASATTLGDLFVRCCIPHLLAPSRRSGGARTPRHQRGNAALFGRHRGRRRHHPGPRWSAREGLTICDPVTEQMLDKSSTNSLVS